MMKYFQFFDLPVSFLLDEKELKKQFLRNSKKYHPDFYTLESEEKQAEILELSTLNNKAYKALRNFDERMAYILKELNVLEEEGKNTIPQSFLMEIMEIQEAIMELEFGFDETSFQNALNAATTLEHDLTNGIQPILNNFDHEKSNLEELIKVKDFYLKKKYLWRIKENLNRFAPALKEA
ncbi:MAG: iron-sulfur cluster co-chaperone HscB C-terminal domain-containing protein [Bacteroidota bacterium]